LLLLFANDFVTMSIANDNVRVSQQPDIWNVRVLVKTAVVIAIAWLAYIFAVFIIGKYELNLPVAPLQTLCFLGLVFSGLANVFLVRERSYFWSSRPGGYLMLASGSDIVCISLMAYFGVLMAPVAWTYILTLLGFTIGYMVLLDLIKVPLLRDDSNPQERVPQAS